MTINEVLTKPTEKEEIQWRIMRSGIKNGKPWAIVVPYPDARAVMKRLDIIGNSAWWDSYKLYEHGVVCSLSIATKDKDGDIAVCTKDGVASYTKIEPAKGGASDALKRAAVKFGMFRDLYEYPTPIFANIHQNGQQRGKAVSGNDTEYFNWDPPKEYMQRVAEKKTEKKDSIQDPDKAPVNMIQKTIDAFNALDDGLARGFVVDKLEQAIDKKSYAWTNEDIENLREIYEQASADPTTIFGGKA